MSNGEMVGFCILGLIVGAVILAYVFGWLDDHIL